MAGSHLIGRETVSCLCLLAACCWVTKSLNKRQSMTKLDCRGAIGHRPSKHNGRTGSANPAVLRIAIKH